MFFFVSVAIPTSKEVPSTLCYIFNVLVAMAFYRHMVIKMWHVLLCNSWYIQFNAFLQEIITLSRNMSFQIQVNLFIMYIIHYLSPKNKAALNHHYQVCLRICYYHIFVSMLHALLYKNEQNKEGTRF